jgi:hypothetical protein
MHWSGFLISREHIRRCWGLSRLPTETYLVDTKTLSRTEYEVMATDTSKVDAAMTVICLNCVPPNFGPNKPTRSMEPIAYPRRLPIADILLALWY